MLQTGQTVEHYLVEHHLGEGAEAMVFRVSEGGAQFALKVPKLGRPEACARLRHEGRAKVRHLNVVAVEAVLELEEGPALLLEFIDGPSLAERLQEGRLPLTDAETLFVELCGGVQAIHRAGWVHRDLKPSNVLLAASGPKVSDFGVAARLDEGAADSPVGTPHYAAPEQTRDPTTVDPRSDVFALGCILYELVCGVRPFVGQSRAELLNATARGVYLPPRQHAPNLARRFADCIGACLEPEPSCRAQSIEEVLAILRGGDARRAAAEPFSVPTLAPMPQFITVGADPEAATAPAPKDRGFTPDSPPRRWWLGVLGGGILLLGIVFGWLLLG